jgi:hypothetical protein
MLVPKLNRDEQINNFVAKITKIIRQVFKEPPKQEMAFNYIRIKD